MPTRTSPATMQQVAALAGVSLKTVSRVVNDEPGVSEAMGERVRAAMNELGYRHNLAASTLRSGGRSHSIGVLVQDLGNAFCADLLRAMEDVARAQGYVVIAASVDEEAERERELVAALMGRRIDGLVLMPAHADRTYLEAERAAGLHVVIVDRDGRESGMDWVISDNLGGAREATEHLLRHGHRRIAFVGDHHAIDTARDRREGFLEAMHDAGIAVEPGWVRADVRDPETAQRAAAQMLDGPRPPTAFFTARNENSVGVMRELLRRGLQDTVAVVGFDDFPTADMIGPGLSVIGQDVAGLGRAAMQRLLARIEGDESPARKIELPTRLIERGSGELAAP